MKTIRIVLFGLLFGLGCNKDEAAPSTGPGTKMPPDMMMPMSPPPDPPPDPPPPSDEPCDSEFAFFDAEVWRPILSVQCLGCHNAMGTAQNTDLILDHADKLASYHAVRRLALEELAGISMLLLKPSLMHPQGHTGGKLIDADSEEFAALTSFVEQAKTEECDGPTSSEPMPCTEVRPGQRKLRRLTGREYDNTITAIFGIESVFGEGFVADLVVNGFDNNADALTISGLLAEQLEAAASQIAELVDLSRIVPCQEQTEACARDFMRSFGEKSYRRPITNAELNRLILLYRLGEDFEDGVRLVITAMLQSPNFLYRSEVGVHLQDGIYELSPYEVASQIAYLLTDSLPDDALFEAAQNDELKTPEQIRSHAARLIDLDASKGTRHHFIDQWLHLDQLRTVPKDNATFPEFSSEIRAAMRNETHQFIDYVLTDGSGTLGELLTANYSFINDSLGMFYQNGTSGLGQAFDKVEYSDGRRAGLLTQGRFLATHARPNSSSPIHRGLIVRERILCQDLPPPPPGVTAEPPELDPSLTTRERYRTHSEVHPCVDCHRLIDPVGFAFEYFDGVGRLREDDFGHAIDAAGEIIDSKRSDGQFTGAAELGTHLASSPDVADCFAKQYFRFAYGIEENEVRACLVSDLQKRFVDHQGDIKNLLLDLASSVHITTRIGDVSTSTGTDPDPEPLPEPEPPETSSLSVQVLTDSDWGAGYCNNVSVTNNGMMAEDWVIELDIDGNINNLWNAQSSGTTGLVRFGGVNWNDILDPGATASFGFCATR
jgi:hypothetical protein